MRLSVSFERQFAQVFSNMRDVLRGLDGEFRNLVRFTSISVHSRGIERPMRLRQERFLKMFKGPLYPPNTILAIDRLVREEFLFEVEAVVAVAG